MRFFKKSFALLFFLFLMYQMFSISTTPALAATADFVPFVPLQQQGFESPASVAVDGGGNVYVVDMSNRRIHKIDSSGNFVTAWGSHGSEEGLFSNPSGIAVDSNGYVYVADMSNHRIQKFDSSGTYIAKWGSNGSGDGQFMSPNGIAVDSNGYVYVADTYNHRIQKFDSSGTYIAKWGSNGSGEDQFNQPRGIAVDSNGYVYVTDYNHRIQKYDSDGVFVTAWGSNGSDNGQFNYPSGVAVDNEGNVYVADTYNHQIQKFDSSGTFIAKWGSNGSGDGQFMSPNGIAVDSNGYVYVADTDNYRLQKFDSTFNLIATWWSQGSGYGQFNEPNGVAVDNEGNVYVTDTMNSRIQKFAATGAFVAAFGVEVYGVKTLRARGITVDSAGNIYYISESRECLVILNPSGQFITWWDGDYTGGSNPWQFHLPNDVAVDGAGTVYIADTGKCKIKRVENYLTGGRKLLEIGTNGTGDGEFFGPCSVALDGNDYLYVADTGNHRIQKLDQQGNYLTKWGTQGNGNGQFNLPSGIAVDSDGYVYVADTGNHRIQKFDATGAFVQAWGSYGQGSGQFSSPRGIAVDSNGNVYVADTGNHRIQVLLAPSGPSNDALLEATSAIKGQTIASLGIPGSTPGSGTDGAVILAAARAADTTEEEPFKTRFEKVNAGATIKAVKYAAGGDTGNFDTDAPYTGEPVAAGDFFIIKVTAADKTTVNYYKIVVTIINTLPGTVHEVSNAAELASALNSFSSGDTIRLTEDIHYTNDIVIDAKCLTFDLNGKTLTLEVEAASLRDIGALEVKNDGIVALSGEGAFNINVTGERYRIFSAVYAEGIYSSAMVTNAKSMDKGAYAKGGRITVQGNAEGGKHGVYALDGVIMVKGDVIVFSIPYSEYGVYVLGGEITVEGNVNALLSIEAGGGTASKIIPAVYAVSGIVKVLGDVITFEDLYGYYTGVIVGNSAKLTVEGTITGPSYKVCVNGFLISQDNFSYGTGADSGYIVYTDGTPAKVLVRYTSAITGIVSDGTNPLAGAVVSLTVNESVYSATTETDGSYRITDVPVGIGYTLTASKSGYTSASAAGVDVTITPITVSITLTPDTEGCMVTYQGAQKRYNEGSNTYDIRFIATINTLDAKEVGFVFSKSETNPIRENATVKATTTVYTSITAAGSTVTAESLDGEYIVACTVTGIPAEDIEVPLQVRAFSTVGTITKYTPVTTVTVKSLP